MFQEEISQINTSLESFDDTTEEITTNYNLMLGSISDLSRLCEFKTDAKNNLSLESECNQLKEISGKYGLNIDLSYAEEGIGSFLKAVWDAIVSTISKIIDWFTNLFGGGSSGGGGGAGSPSEKVDKNLKKAEEAVKKTEKTVLKIPHMSNHALKEARKIFSKKKI